MISLRLSKQWEEMLKFSSSRKPSKVSLSLLNTFDSFFDIFEDMLDLQESASMIIEADIGQGRSTLINKLSGAAKDSGYLFSNMNE